MPTLVAIPLVVVCGACGAVLDSQGVRPGQYRIERPGEIWCATQIDPGLGPVFVLAQARSTPSHCGIYPHSCPAPA